MHASWLASWTWAWWGYLCSHWCSHLVQSHLGWCPHLDGHLPLCLCSHSCVVHGHIGGHHGYGVHGCGHNVGGGVAGMGNQQMMVVMKKEG